MQNGRKGNKFSLKYAREEYVCTYTFMHIAQCSRVMLWECVELIYFDKLKSE